MHIYANISRSFSFVQYRSRPQETSRSYTDCMTDHEVFSHLFAISDRVLVDGSGTVVSCLVRDGKILIECTSPEEAVHSEYWLLKEAEHMGITILSDDVVYTTVEPCGRRTPGGRGEQMGDCTTNLLQAGVKHVVYAAADPDASAGTRHKYVEAGAELRQVEDPQIVCKAFTLFNDSLAHEHDRLPKPFR